MNGAAYGSSFRDRGDDRVDEGISGVDRSIHTDKAVFKVEIKRIFEGGWVFLRHESQVERLDGYFATESAASRFS